MGRRIKTNGYHPHISDFQGMRLFALCVFFTIGVAAGHIAAQLLGADSELSAHLHSYALLETEATPATSAATVVALYFRYPLMVFVFWCCNFPVAAMLPVLSVQGFSLSFAAASLAATLGRKGVALALAAFGLRGFLSLIATLLLAQLFLLRTADSSESKGKPISKILIVCVLLLAVGVVLELTVMPKLFSLALAMLK